MNDFWTGDVYVLHGLIPQGLRQPVRAIGEEIALADADSCTCAYPHAKPRRTGRARLGYGYRVFAAQDDGERATTLWNDADGQGAYGEIHDRARFALLAFPASERSFGMAFSVNADNTIRRYHLPQSFSACVHPLSVEGDSDSTIRGTGNPLMDDASVFPASPGSIGCSKGGS